jgi:hypothetical protein
MNRTAETDDVEAIARCLAQEARSRLEKKRGYAEADDFADALDWLGYMKDARRLSEEGARLIGGKLVI